MIAQDVIVTFPTIVKSPATSQQLAIQKLYVAYFGRPAEFAGMAYWHDALTTQQITQESIASEFAKSSEYKASFVNGDGTQMSAAESVAMVYLNLFGRAAEPAGLDYWSKALASQVVTISDIVLAVTAGAQGTDLVAINCKILGAHYFTSSMVTAADVLYYSGPEAMAAARLYIKGIVDEKTLEAVIGTTPPIRHTDMPTPFDAEVPLWPAETATAEEANASAPDAGVVLIGLSGAEALHM